MSNANDNVNAFIDLTLLIHTYIHNKSYSAQSYIKQSDCALQKSTHVQMN